MPINQPFSFSTLPIAVRSLLVVNVAVFLIQQFAGYAFLQFLGLVPSRVLHEFTLWQLTTYMFLHGSFIHLLFNMYILWAFGREIEIRWGAASFLWFYFVCGWGAAFFNVVLSPGQVAPSLGASGAIYGVLVAFATLFPNTVLYLYFMIPMKVKHAVILFAVIEFLAGFSGTSTGIANFAHLGGLVTGFLYLKGGNLRQRVRQVLHRIEAEKKFPKQKKSSVKFHDLSQEVDRILDKILKKGINSLTQEERNLMKKYSDKKK